MIVIYNILNCSDIYLYTLYLKSVSNQAIYCKCIFSHMHNLSFWTVCCHSVSHYIKKFEQNKQKKIVTVCIDVSFFLIDHLASEKPIMFNNSLFLIHYLHLPLSVLNASSFECQAFAPGFIPSGHSWGLWCEVLSLLCTREMHLLKSSHPPAALDLIPI